MEQADSLASQHVPGGIAHACMQPPELEVRTEKVDRAATDLQADYQRQSGFLSLAQFDRLVLRRNLTPPEMIALIAKLASMGVSLDGPRAAPLPDDQLSTRGAVPKDEVLQDFTSFSRQGNPYALLSQREEIELGRRVQLALRTQEAFDPSKVDTPAARDIVKRGRAARDRMVLANLRLVRFVIRNIRRPLQSLDTFDLFQEGSIGLMRAVEKFDPELGLRFSTYALWWIRQAIFRGLDDSDRMIRLPVHRMQSLRKLRYTTRRLSFELGRTPTMRELSEALNWPIEKTLFIQRLTELECVSLDTPIGDEDDRTIADTIASKERGPFEATRQMQTAELLQRFLAQLTPRQKLVIERRFGLGNSPIPETLQQVGDDLGVTRERIRQIEAKALLRLGKWVNRRIYDAL